MLIRVNKKNTLCKNHAVLPLVVHRDAGCRNTEGGSMRPGQRLRRWVSHNLRCRAGINRDVPCDRGAGSGIGIGQEPHHKQRQTEDES